MPESFINIHSISEFHRYYSLESPKHPLVSVIDLTKIKRKDTDSAQHFHHLGLYAAVYKKFDGSFKYGRSDYDFQEGALMFIAPDQIVQTSSDTDTEIDEGWFLAFHPDFIYGSELGKKIRNYTFFEYASNEALYVSDEEKKTLETIISTIETEYSKNIDRHTQGLILNNIELLLNYCDRFYERQFLTRSKVSSDVLQNFEQLLNHYFNDDNLIDKGIPEVKYFAEKLHLSSNYLSDLLTKYSGKTTIEHIHLKLVDKAKNLLLGTSKSISEIAYELGFEHPSHFTKVFKTKTGLSPLHFRKNQIS